MSCYVLLQGIFSAQGWNPPLLHLLHWQVESLSLALPGFSVLCLSVMFDSCSPIDCSLPGSSVHGILQARILDWISFPSPGGLPDPGTESRSPALHSDSLLTELWGKPNLGSPYSSFSTLIKVPHSSYNYWSYPVSELETELSDLVSPLLYIIS